MHTALNLNALYERTSPLPEPVLVRNLYVAGEDSWLVSTMRTPVKMVFPRQWYTSEQAIDEFCEQNGIDRQNIITKITDETED